MTWRDELEDSRREREVEVAFWDEHPYDRPTGERLAAQFVALLTEQVKIFELTNDPKTLPEAERAPLDAALHRSNVFHRRTARGGGRGARTV